MEAALPLRAETKLRWPMVFEMEKADESLLESAKFGLDLHHDYDDSPERVHHSFLGFVGDPPWSPGFVGVDWWTPEGQLDGAVMDELYAFMAMRVHVTHHEPGRLSIAYVSRWSLPFATRMVQRVETTRLPNGKTRLRYRVAYDAPRAFHALIPGVEWIFSRWFRLSFEGLERYLKSHP